MDIDTLQLFYSTLQQKTGDRPVGLLIIFLTCSSPCGPSRDSIIWRAGCRREIF